MKHGDQGGYILEPAEVRALARQIVGDALTDDYHLERIVHWEDVPELTEGTWRALDQELRRVGDQLLGDAQRCLKYSATMTADELLKAVR